MKQYKDIRSIKKYKEMPKGVQDYKTGKIYKIWSPLTTNIYIGSTCDTLTNRMLSHKNAYNRWVNGTLKAKTFCYDLFNEVGISNCKIELVKLWPCNSKDELVKEEGNVMRDNITHLVNKKIEGRSWKEWHKLNLKTFVDYQKEYRNQKKEELKTKRDTDEKKAEMKAYQTERRKIRYTCECGVNISIAGKAHHNKTEGHLKFLELNKSLI